MRAVVLVAVAVVACERDPVDSVCPDVVKGQLVITEIRGKKTDLPWLEIYNASGGAVDLHGAKIRFRRLDGSSEVPVLVRRELPFAANAYAVLGLSDDAALPPELVYGFADDFRVQWLSSAAIDVESCGTLIDRAVYDSLPDTGTASLGSTPPSADDNDVPTNWCTVSFGTPNSANPPCP